MTYEEMMKAGGKPDEAPADLKSFEQMQLEDETTRAAQSGDWTKVRELMPPEERPEPEHALGLGSSVPETVAAQSLQGVTKRWGDELAGWLGAKVAPKDPNAFVRRPDGSLVSTLKPEEVQKALRDQYRARLAEQKKANPATSFVSGVAGDIGGDLALAATGAPLVSKLLSRPGMVASGAVSGAGDAEGDSLASRLGGAGLGAAGSLAGQAVGRYVLGPLASKVAPRVESYLRDFAGKRAAKAAGAIQSDIRGMGDEKVKQMGLAALRMGLVRPFRGPEGVRKAAEQMAEEVGPSVGKAMQEADLSAAARTTRPFNWLEALAAVRKQTEGATIPKQRVAEQVVKEIEEQGLQPGAGYALANELKSDLANQINWMTGDKMANQVRKQLAGAFRENIDKQYEREMGEKAAEAFRTDKELYGLAKTLEKWGAKGAARETGNRWISPSDYFTAAVGAGGAGPLALALAALHKFLRERGSSVLAPAAYSVAEGHLPRKAAAAAATPIGSKLWTEMVKEYARKKEEPGG